MWGKTEVDKRESTEVETDALRSVSEETKTATNEYGGDGYHSNSSRSKSLLRQAIESEPRDKKRDNGEKDSRKP